MAVMEQKAIESIYGLSPLQRGMLFHTLYDRHSGAYCQQVTAVLRGDLEVGAFKAAWLRVIDRHPILRSSLVWEKLDQPVQVVHREVGLPLRLVDGSDLDASRREERFQELLAEERRSGFELTSAPLMRLVLIKEAPDRHRLLWSYHHLLLDGWSLALVLREVFTCFEALRLERPLHLPPCRPYRDYVSWLKKQDPEPASRFWRGLLEGFREPTSLGVDYKTKLGNQGATYRELRAELPVAVTRALQEVAQSHHLTLNVIVQGAWSLLLSRYSGSDDVLFGTTVSGRPADLAGVESMVGLFINTLPMRTRVEPDRPILEWLADLQRRQVEMRQFEHMALPDVQSLSQVDHGVPLFESILVFESYPVDSTADLAGGAVKVEGLRYVEQTHYPLTVLAVPGERLSLGLACDMRRFDPRTVERMLGHLRRILEQLAQRPEARVGQISMLSGAEQELALKRPTAPEEAGACAHRIFESCAERWPQATAVISDEGELTYQELDRQANRLAHRLSRHGIAAEDRVGICLERSSKMIVALLGVLKSGAAYVPLDPAYPGERLQQMIDDARPRAVVVEAGTRDRLEGPYDALQHDALQHDALGGHLLVDLDAEAGALAQESPEGLPPASEPDNLAYVLYTSGSTGTPKGVMVCHRSLVRYTRSMIDQLGLQVGDRFLEFAPLTFDASVVQIFPTLLSGATLSIHRQVARLSNLELLRLCEQQRISVLDLPAAFWHQWLDDLAAQGITLRPPLRFFLTGGESSFKENLRTWAGLAPPGSGFLTSYGPTEATVGATVFTTDSGRIDELALDRVPLGRPLPHVGVYLLDPDLRPVPPGVTGALYLAGAGLSRGYLGQPALTARRFLPDPHAGRPGARLYATGDLARSLPDGTLEFRGREDGQVKVRGFRIELTEIETALARHPDLRAAVVTVSQRAGGKDLVAYVVPEGEAIPDPAVLRDELAGKLPDFMIPAFFIPLEQLPVTPHGKIDRAALPAPQVARPRSSGELVAPQTEIERVLAEIWAGVLEIEQVGRHDDFFALGGHSLSATQLVSRIRAYFQVELPLATLFEKPTLAEVAPEIEAALGRGGAGAPEAIQPGDRQVETAPLSLSQQRLWFLDQLNPGDSVYNLPLLLRLHGSLDAAALERSFRELVHRHESLRTTFVQQGDEPVQRIRPAVPVRLPVVDLRGLDEEERGRQVDRLGRREGRRPFELSRGPLFRTRLLRLAPGEHLLLVTQHHIVSDGWSMGILIREVVALYQASLEGAGSPLPPLSIQYRDFARWQRKVLAQDRWRESVAYWRENLAGASGALALPTDRRRPATPRFEGGRERTVLDPELTERLKATSQAERATLFMTLLAAYKLLLYRYSGETDLLVGTPVANRTQESTEGLIGFFLNTLVLRTRLQGDWTFRRLLEDLRGTAIAAFAHQDVPFEQLLEVLQPERQTSATPLFQVMFNMQSFAEPRIEVPELTLESLEPAEDRSKFDLTLFAEERRGRLRLELVYSRDLFEAATARQMLRHLERVLRAVIENPNVRLTDVPLLGDEATAPPRWLAASTGGVLFPAAEIDQPVDALFRRRAAAHPEHTAVEDAHRAWTYGRLDREADHLARRILELRGDGEERIALLLPHGVPQSAGMLAALRCGKTYVPLDPSYPPRRLEHMLADSGARAILTVPGHRALAAELAAGELDLVELDPDREAPAGAPLQAQVSPASCAYLLYTSGSTGRPKGAIQSHRNLLHHIRCYTNNLGITGRDRLLQVASYSFDAAVMDVYGALLNGATLYPFDVKNQEIGQLGGWLRRQGITIYHSTPTVYRHFLDSLADEEAFPALRLVVLGGEEVVLRDVERYRRRFSEDCVLINGFGPTESTLCLQLHLDKQTPIRGTRVPIGVPVEGNEVVLVDASGREIADVGVGEIAIRSRYLVLGYWQRPEQTRQAFQPDAGDPDLRTYRTGDVGRRRFDGAFEYLGRADSQIKIRGFRVETAEVEAVLSEHPEVREALVVAGPDARQEQRLVAYFIPEGPAPRDQDLRRHLMERLPDYMVPSCFVEMESFPLTPTGKVQRSLLPPPPDKDRSAVERRPPRDPVEEIVAATWSEVLGTGEISIDDSFFELGGHSLLATQVVSRLQKRFDVELPLRRLFEEPTVEALAEVIRRGRRGSRPPAPRIGTVTRRSELPLSYAQQRLWFLDQVEPGNPAYVIPAAVDLTGPLDHAVLEASLNEVVRRHEVLRMTFAKGSNGPVQTPAASLRLEIPVEDLSHLPAPERRRRALAMAVEEAARPFDLEAGPLLRARLLALGGDEHLLLFSIHHIVSDGWSMGLLVSELATLYGAFAQGRPSPLPELPIQYADFAHWQRRYLSGEVLESHLSYWRSQLGERPPVLRLTERQPEARTNRGERLSFQLPDPVTAALKSLTRQHGATLYMTLLAAFQTLLSRLTGQDDFIVGTAIANRNRREVEPLIGFFVNMLPLRSDLSGQPRFSEVLQRSRRLTLDSYAYQDLPFETLVRELAPKRELDRNPLFQVFFGMLDIPEPGYDLGELKLKRLDLDYGFARFDLSLFMAERDGTLQGTWLYSPDLYDQARIHQWTQLLQRLLSLVAEAPEQRIHQVDLFPDRRRSQDQAAEKLRAARLRRPRKRTMIESES